MLAVSWIFLDESLGLFFITVVSSVDDIRTGIRHIPMLRPDHDKPNPRSAINAKFNSCGKLMMTLSGKLDHLDCIKIIRQRDHWFYPSLESIPTTACIWDMSSMTNHAIIVQQEPIVAAYWHPKISSLLAICCEGGRFYIWQDGPHNSHRSSITAINVPAGK